MAITAEDLKKLSPRMKAVLVFLACLLVAYFYYMFYLQSAFDKKNSLDGKLAELKQDIAAKQKVAAQKEKYIQDLKKLTETFQLALTKLPDKKEIPGLFESISLAGRNSGIEFLLFEPMILPPACPVKEDAGNKKRKTAPGAGGDKIIDSEDKFYAEIPIKVKIVGSFQNTLEFFDKISKLPRIINVENLTLSESKQLKSKGNMIATSCVIKTYMFLDKEKANGNGSNDVLR